MLLMGELVTSPGLAHLQFRMNISSVTYGPTPAPVAPRPSARIGQRLDMLA